MTDARGRPCVMAISPGNTSDYMAAHQCLAAIPPAREVIADKGYDSDALRRWLQHRGSTPVIPPRSNRKVQYDYDKRLYRERNVIERTFNRLKDFRRIHWPAGKRSAAERRHTLRPEAEDLHGSLVHRRCHRLVAVKSLDPKECGTR